MRGPQCQCTLPDVLNFGPLFKILPFRSGVEGHFDHHPYGRGWVKMQDHTTPFLAELVGEYQQIHQLLFTLEQGE